MSEQPNIKPNYYKPPVNPYIRQYGEMLGKISLRPPVELKPPQQGGK